MRWLKEWRIGYADNLALIVEGKPGEGTQVRGNRALNRMDSIGLKLAKGKTEVVALVGYRKNQAIRESHKKH